jgi:putative transposase
VSPQTENLKIPQCFNPKQNIAHKPGLCPHRPKHTQKMSLEGKHTPRKSEMILNEVYFWTDTIKNWQKLLEHDTNKSILIECWKNLISREKIKLYAFVIMPNHIHAIWEMVDMNGKEMPYASFNKFTSHQFLEQVRLTPQIIPFKDEHDRERKHRFWQRDPLAVLMYSKSIVEQKIEYIHLNPLQEHWNLANKPENYRWSSARFYETGFDEFGIITNYRERF